MAKGSYIATQTVKVGKKYFAPGATLPTLSDAIVADLVARRAIAAVDVPVDDREPEPHALSIERLKEHLETVTDPDVLEELHNAERAHKNRAGALKEIEDRLAALDESDPDPDGEEQ